jgi:DNA-binding transcriptional regulator of glucitol operon
METATFVVGALALAWFIQLGFSYWQMKRFYGRISQLRKSGRLAIGLEGGMYKGRQYGVLVVDEQENIVRAEQLSGLTIFAQLKPVEPLIGLKMSRLFEDEKALAQELKITKKQVLAFRNAAKYLQEAEARAEAKKRQAEETALASSTAA